jgi:hypothetical protein
LHLYKTKDEDATEAQDDVALNVKRINDYVEKAFKVHGKGQRDAYKDELGIPSEERGYHGVSEIRYAQEMCKLFCVRKFFSRMHVALLADPALVRENQLRLHFPKGRLHQDHRIRPDEEAEGYS